MPSLHLSLLGPPQLIKEGTSLTGFVSGKVQALLYYLAVTGSRHTRDSLCDLLWPEVTGLKARISLRTALSNLRTQVGEALIITRESAQFDPTSLERVDVHRFEEALSALSRENPREISLSNQIVGLQKGVALYRGNFLQGFHVRGAPDFERWLLLQQEHYHELAVSGLLRLAQLCLDAGELDAGLAATRKLLALDPWRELAHQQQMLILARMGRRPAALHQFDLCRQLLAEEFGVEPMAETRALYQRILNSPKSEPTLSAHLNHGSMAAPSSGAADHLSISPSPTLIGREAELAQLTAWVHEPAVRIIVICGVGGQGKTALVQEFCRLYAMGRRGTGEDPVHSIRHDPRSPVHWHSLHQAPLPEELLRTLIASLAQADAPAPGREWEACAPILQGLLAKETRLVVLDSLQEVIQESGTVWRPGYERYLELITLLAPPVQSSCLVLLSRHWHPTLLDSAISSQSIRILKLQGLAPTVGAHFLASSGMPDSPQILQERAARYAGNPLALQRLATLATGSARAEKDGNGLF